MKLLDTGLQIDSVSVLVGQKCGARSISFATVHLNQGALHLHNFTIVEDNRGSIKVCAPFRTKRTGERVETIGFSAGVREFIELAVIQEYRRLKRGLKMGSCSDGSLRG